MTTKLVVTEKEKMAYNIASSLGGYSQHSLALTKRRRIKIYEVAGKGGEEDNYVILPLNGHIMSYVTRASLERWTYDSVNNILNDPKSLVKIVTIQGYSSAIRSLADKASEVIIATDSDEEGENIGLELTEILGNYSKPIKRLWLTTTIPSDIRKSLLNLRVFNTDLALSVEARRKIDALVGFAGTREVTLSLRRAICSGRRGFLSFGRVQTSTLWLVVQREKEIKSFTPRPFWDITANVENTKFTHSECPIFDREHAFDIYGRIRNAEKFNCTDVQEKTEYLQPPKPLNTAELLRTGTNLLHISPSKVLSLAETLYLQGKITYPRVDNQTYTSSFDHKQNLAKLEKTRFGEYSDSLLREGLTTPTRGRFSEDHEPITPVAAMTEDKDQLAYRLYEIILRHYLSIFGPAAKFLDTMVKGAIRDELFHADGRKLIDPGFYRIYYYHPLEERPINYLFKPGKQYEVEKIDIEEKQTKSPPRYTYSALLAGMERHGIGTKSTRPSMIDTLKYRVYIHIYRSIISPTERGMKFIASIEKPWGQYISPEFTSRVESEMKKIAQGKRSWEDLVESERRTFAQAIEVFRKDRRTR